MESRPAPDTRSSAWFIAQRWREFHGESRAGLLRLVALAVFYAIELVNYHGLSMGPLQMPQVVSPEFHRQITFLAMSWALMGAGVVLCLRRGYLPFGLKYVSTGWDLVILTYVLLVADGARSPLVVAYFVIVALSSLRLQARLVEFATAGAILGYGFLLGYARWLGLERPPHYHSVIFVAALALCGAIAREGIRGAAQMAGEYLSRATGDEGAQT